MSEDYYEDLDGPPSTFSRWILPALFLSLLLHVVLWAWARDFRFMPPADQMYERLVPPAFHLERVEIDPELLRPNPEEEHHQAPKPEKVTLPEEKVAFEQLMGENKGTPTAPKIDQAILSEKPTAAATTLNDTLQAAREAGAQSVLKDDSQSLQEALLADKTGSGTRAEIVSPEALTGRAIAKAGDLRGGDRPGFSNLDQLLAQTGPLSSGTAPILMPTDLLFDYDSAELRMQAMASMEKLGTLIRRNPQAVFLIEGHTDSYGPDDYNMQLSQKRADMVKDWLIQTMQIPADRVEARGYGKTRLIAPATGSIDEQQINRRVEIVIRDKKGH